MEYTLENNELIVRIKSKGAELASIVGKNTKLEYMWSANPAFWGKSSPVLFPIVGALKSNTYYYQGKMYTLPRHGFARDEMFQVEKQQRDEIVFLLTSSPSSLEKYPFSFELRIIYTLEASELRTTYHVTNTGHAEMYFSIGAHPAFAVPLANGKNYEDYYLHFNQVENAERWPISPEGLIESQPTPLLQGHKLPLTKPLFYGDALVFKKLHSDCISLRCDSDGHGLDFYFHGFPFMGIWAAKDADFVCIEPWCGIADAVNHDQQLENKEGIEKLSAGDSWQRAWSVKMY